MHRILKKSWLSLTLLLPTLLHAQQHDYRFTGELNNRKPGMKVYLCLPKGENGYVIDSAVSDNGKFSFTGKTDTIALALLQIAPAYDGSVYESKKIVIEPGNIVLKSEGMLSAGTFTGSKINEDYLTYVQFDDALNKEFNAINGSLEGDQIALRNVQLRLSAAKHDFIIKHADSFFSLLFLKELLRNAYIPADVADSLYRHSGNKYKSTVQGTQLKELIQRKLLVQDGRTAPDFTHTDIHGKQVSLSDYRGKYVLLEFWASWCAPCRAESPQLIAAYNQYKDAGFTILSVSLDKKGARESWLAAITKDGTGAWTHVGELNYFNDRAAKLYGVPHLPYNFLIDPAGKIIATDLRGDQLAAALKKIL